MTYKALSRIYWQYFTSWLKYNERELVLKSKVDKIVEEFSLGDSNSDEAVEAVDDLLASLKLHKV